MNDDITASSMNEDGDSSHSVSLGDFIFPCRQSSSIGSALSPRATAKSCRDIVTLPYHLEKTSGKAKSSVIADDSLSQASSDKQSSMSSLSDSPQKAFRPCVRFNDSAILRKLTASRSSIISLDDSFNSIDLELALPDSTPALSPLPVTSPLRRSKSIKLLVSENDLQKISCHDRMLNDNYSISSSVIDNKVEGEGEGDSTSTHEHPEWYREPTDDDDSPEAIVRRETTTLRVFRVFLYLLLACVMGFAVYSAYATYLTFEQERFESQLDAIAVSLLTAMLQETHVKLLMSTAVASLMMELMDVGKMTPLNLTVPMHSFAETFLIDSNAVSLSWGPVLRTRNELETFETFANATMPNGIFRFVNDSKVTGGNSSPPYLPIWLGFAESEDLTMFNQFSDDLRARSLNRMLATQLPVLSEIFLRKGGLYQNVEGEGQAGLIMNSPVVSKGSRGDIVGSITSEFLWSSFLRNTTHPIHSDLVDVVVENTCGQAYTFRATEASELALIAEIDAHDIQFDEMGQSTTYADFNAMILEGTSRNVSEFDYCRYRFSVYPTSELRRVCTTNKRAVAASIASFAFLLITGCFITYDYLVSRRQNKVMETARRSTKIVSSLFPKSFRGRLYDEAVDGGSMCTGVGSSNTGKSNGASAKGGGESSTYLSSRSQSTASATTNTKKLLSLSQRNRLKTFLETSSGDEADSDPIADYYPEATVMFLDIVGFTAWSSEREPSQVFRLLESVFRSLDEVLRRYGVFKIETIGDSYVCVTGVPERMEDHAVAMTRFAFESLRRFNLLTKQLETQLGPATGELQARIGLHSGPVTAGVIRGERARFQLFGDTMNTASRMESNGAPGRIQASEATALLLRKAGKERWITSRPDLITAKGKGQMQTYWLAPALKSMRSERANSSDDDVSDIDGTECRHYWDYASTDTSSVDPSHTGVADLHLREACRVSKLVRLVEWNVEILSGFLQKIVLSRGCGTGRPRLTRGSSMASLLVSEDEGRILGRTGTVLDELEDVIEMPRFDPRQARRLADGEQAELDPTVKEQLREYVMRIASMHRNLPFHDFEHASHVTMSASKLLGRLSKFQRDWNTEKKELDNAKEVHQATYGISSDPLMQFVIVLASLVHDVDHTGMTNAQLIQLKAPKAIMYKNRLVSEQNSLEVAWTVLMDNDFEQVRNCIYSNKQELRRFRQLFVNAFLATDLADPTLLSERQTNWDRAFAEGTDGSPAPTHGRIKRDSKVDEDRKATVVFECIVQAAHVAHAMQHWITFTKWSERLFTERILMAKSGDGVRDNPVRTWFQTELELFDRHVIPLTEKLKDSCVFGSSSCEFLNWALENRREWELHGESIVERMYATFNKHHPVASSSSLISRAGDLAYH